jgi:1,2-diacylglycerol 3-beta-glucosyltransferase
VNDYLLGGVNAAAFLLCASFLAYVACIVVPLVRHRRGPTGDPAGFAWHFVVPCLNEERVIAPTVADLLTSFPAAHVWCVDDASSDATHQIVSRLARRDRRVHLVSRYPPDAQQGKGPALNAAWAAISRLLPPDADLDRIIVGVVDADGILDPACTAVLAGPSFFGRPEVGAVQIQVRVVNQDEGASAGTRTLIRMQDLEFSCVIAGMQMLRRHVGSTAMGGNGQFTRASALQRVTDTYGTPWATALLEDFELGLRVLLTGGRTEYCHDTFVVQQGPPTVGRLVRQRCRWAQGLMQCFKYFLPVMRSRRISSSAAMEIAMFLLLPWFQLLGVLVYLVSLVLLAYYAVTTTGGPLHWFGAGAWGLIPLFLIFGLAPLAFWGPIYRRTAARDLTRRRALFLGLVNWPYSYIHHVSTWWAFGRMLRSRHDWKKTERLEPAHQAARAAPVRRPVAPTAAPTGSGRAGAPPVRVLTPVGPSVRPMVTPSVVRAGKPPAPKPRSAVEAAVGAPGRPRRSPVGAPVVATRPPGAVSIPGEPVVAGPPSTAERRPHRVRGKLTVSRSSGHGTARAIDRAASTPAVVQGRIKLAATPVLVGTTPSPGSE